MRRIKHTLQEVIIFLVVMFVSLLTTILIIIDTSKPIYYNLLWILPFMYTLFSFLIWIKLPIIKYKVSATIILLVYSVRMVAVPLAMALGDYSSYGDEKILNDNMPLALVLMCWEFLMVTILIISKFSQRNKYIKTELFVDRVRNNRYLFELPKSLRFAIFSVFLYLVLILIGTPGLLQESFFLTTGRSEESYALYFSGSISHNAFGLSFGPQLITIAFTFFWVLQVLLPPYLLARICIKIESKKIRNILFIVVLLFTMLISTEGRAHSIESAIALIITATVSLREKIRIKPVYLIIFLGLVTLYGLMDKSGVSTSSEIARNEFSVMLSAYASGPQNVATAIEMTKETSFPGIVNVATDFLQRIPYLTKIFTAWYGGTTNVIFNQYFGNKYLGQIIPSIGLGYFYFGFVFSPIVPCVAVGISLFFEKKAQAAQNILSQNLFYLGVIMMARATAMSNMLSGITYLGNFFFAWIVLYMGLKKTISAVYR